MKAAKVDAIVLRNPENVLFTTGYWPITGWSVFCLKANGKSSLLVPESELGFLDKQPVDEVTVLPEENLSEIYDPYKRIRSFIGDLGLKAGSRVGVELSMETLATVHTGAELSFMGNKTLGILRDHDGFHLVDFTDALHKLRTIKTEDELGRILIACEIAGLGLQEGLQHLGQGVSEAELASTIEGAIGTVGVGHRGTRLARGFAYVMSGENGSRASLPFNVSSKRKMRAGDSVLVELNVQADGFWADMTRTWFVGKPSPEHQRYHEVVREANEKAIEYAKEGVPVKEVDAVAREVVSASGIGHMFNHRLGHGVGFRLHEPPSIHPASNETLGKNTTFTIEPGVYGRGFGIRIEDVVVARSDGSERLSKFRREWG